MLNEEFMKNLESMDPVRREQMMTLLKTISSPPERILDLLDRLEIPWERKRLNDESCLIIRWKDLTAGEARNQEEGPILKRLLKESAPQQDSVDLKVFGQEEPIARHDSATGSRIEGAEGGEPSDA